MATIIFDFDDTLFSSKKLKEKIFTELASHGIEKNIVEETYKECRDHYCLSRHAQILKNKHNLEIPKKAHDWIFTFDFESHLLPGSIETLKKLSKKHDLILLTSGENEFQNIKIKGTNISKYFKEIHIIKDKKETFLKNKKFPEPIYFVNDKDSENEKIKKEFPNFLIIKKIPGDNNPLDL